MYLGHFSHNPAASVPWAEIRDDDDQRWMEAKFWPLEVEVKDPSKLKAAEATVLYQHWRRRQDKNVVPLEFCKALDKDRREGRSTTLPRPKPKPKPAQYMEVSSQDSDDEDSADEDVVSPPAVTKAPLTKRLPQRAPVR
jgi:hypothetical protein